MDNKELFLLIYVVVMTFIGMWIMYYDKSCARRKKWRVPERVLFLISLVGGSLGTWAGMYMFRHKTKHWYFVLGMPLIFFAHIALVYFLFIK